MEKGKLLVWKAPATPTPKTGEMAAKSRRAVYAWDRVGQKEESHGDGEQAPTAIKTIS